jgi:hypothetical protein
LFEVNLYSTIELVDSHFQDPVENDLIEQEWTDGEDFEIFFTEIQR